MTTKRRHWKRKTRLSLYGATLNDINAKLSIILSLLEQRDSGCLYVPPDNGEDGGLEDNDNGDNGNHE